MQRLQSQVLLHGAIGGLLAGAVVAGWFLVLDLFTTGVLHTPTVLGSAMLGDAAVASPTRLVLGYTVLHFGVFAALGMAVAWFLHAIGASPGVGLGLVVGLGVLNAVHYGALLVTGVGVLTLLPEVHVLAANLVGGMALAVYLHYATDMDAPLGLAVLREHPQVADGLIVGMLGALSLALWFLLVDVVAGRPFQTPAALGSLVFLNAGGTADVVVTPGIVAAYTMLHLAAFALAGLALTWAAEMLERMPSFWFVGLLGFVILEGLFLMSVVAMGSWVLGILAWWNIAFGNVLAMAAMIGWLWAKRPELRRRLSQPALETRL